MLVVLLMLHAVIAVITAATGRRLRRGAFALAGLPPALTILWATANAPAVVAGRAVEQNVDWVPSIGLVVGLRLDAFSLLLVALVSGIGVLVFAYAGCYFPATRTDLGRYAGLLCGFSGAMLGLVTTDNLLLLFVFWELTSITSYLLIGLEHTKPVARAAALQALLITGAGGLVLLAGLLLLGQAAGTFSLTAIAADPPNGPLLAAAALCVLVGIATKSAQVPFHAWLPGAMAAPTPVSAYLHSATMVKAGVYLAARLAPVLVVSTAVWRPAAMTLGAVTMIIGGWRALRQHDLKLLLAFGTVSQLGFMVVLVSAGTESAAQAGAAVLLAHGLFKAALFMVVGVVDHACGTRDLRRLTGVGRRLPLLAAAGTIAAASMAGLPLLFGFVAKEAALTALLDVDALGAAAPLWLAAVATGSALTVAYSARFVWGAFASKPAAVDAAEVHHAPSAAFIAPPVLLAVVTLVLGLLPALGGPLVNAATVAIDPHAHPHDLALWHGLGTPLYLTAAILAAGSVLVLRRDRVERIQDRLPHLPGSAEAYTAALTALPRVAVRTTAFFQNGSLPMYLGVILAVAVAVPSAALLAAAPTSGLSAWAPARFADSPLQIAAVVAAIAAALGAATARRRFAAVLALGGVGYAVVTIFALHGAPDLALTQLLVETLGIVVFVLALRHLPPRFAVAPGRLSQSLRAGLAGAVGIFIAGFALAAGAARGPAPGVSAEFLSRAEKAGGSNVVNVVLVDFRGFDTLGEITVLGVAALGVAALVLARCAQPSDEAGLETPDGGTGDDGHPGHPGRAVPAPDGDLVGSTAGGTR